MALVHGEHSPPAKEIWQKIADPRLLCKKLDTQIWTSGLMS